MRVVGFVVAWIERGRRRLGGECRGSLELWSGLALVFGRFPKVVCYSLQTQAVSLFCREVACTYLIGWKFSDYG